MDTEKIISGTIAMIRFFLQKLHFKRKFEINHLAYKIINHDLKKKEYMITFQIACFIIFSRFNNIFTYFLCIE